MVHYRGQWLGQIVCTLYIFIQGCFGVCSGDALRAVSTGMLIVAQLILDEVPANKHHSAHVHHVHTSMTIAESEASPLILPLPPLPVPPSLAELHSHQRMLLKKYQKEQSDKGANK